MAQEAAGVSPDTIGYIEAHGTGTPLGDPIELAALTQAFSAKTVAKQFCGDRDRQTNVGHLDVGRWSDWAHQCHKIFGDIACCLPTLHFHSPNPKFDLGNSPFFINTKLKEWKSDQKPKRAGVSAFGVGGTKRTCDPRRSASADFQ